MALTDLIIAASEHQLIDGIRKTVTGSNPAANTEFSETIPAGKAWVLQCVTVSLVQGITQTPQPTLVLDDGTNIFFEGLGASSAQNASVTCQYAWAPGLTLTAGGAATVANAPLPAGGGWKATAGGPVLGPGFRIRSITAGIGANTDYGAPVFYVVEYQIS